MGTTVRFGVLLGVLLLALLVGRDWPKDQALRYVIGNAAPSVEEVRVRWADAGGQPASPGAEDWTREATFRYADGSAPRVIPHELRLANGPYTVEFAIVLAHGANRAAPADEGARRATTTRIVRRHLTLEGGTLSVDLASPLLDDQSTTAGDLGPHAAAVHP